MREIKWLENLTGKKVKLKEFLSDLYLDDPQEYLQSLIDRLKLPFKITHLIGEGTFGFAGIIEDGSVVKLDTSLIQVELLQKVMKHNFKHIVKVYGIYPVPIVDKKQNPKKAWLIHKQFIPFLPTQELENAIENFEQSDYNIDSVENSQLKEQLKELEKELKVIGLAINNADIFPSNVGWLNGKLILFDPLG